MVNSMRISSSDNDIEILFKIHASPWGLTFLSIINIALIGLFIAIINQIPVESAPSAFVPLLLFILLFVFFPLRYLLWNLYGEEYVYITKKSLSYSRNYG